MIHFNWGIHDLKFMPDGKRQVEAEDYRKNLRALVTRMKTTRARLNWASTTPIPDGELNPPRTFGKVPEYNAIAEKVMKENGLAIDDLNAAIIPRIAGLQSTKDMHFKSEGSAFLAKGRCRVVTACRRHERSVPCEPFHMTYIVRCFLYAPFVRLFPWL